MWRGATPTRAVALAVVMMLATVAACSDAPGRAPPPAATAPSSPTPVSPDEASPDEASPDQASPDEADGADTDVAPDAIASTSIVVHPDRVLTEIDPRVLGTNVPAWLGREVLADETFRALTRALGTTLARLPGGSWSNHDHWSACEERDPDACYWTWAATPSELLEFVDATGLEASWTVAINGTAEEAAALVAFANGDPDDDRAIGVDRHGRDWSTIGHWARRRADGGLRDPAPIALWEIGNEIYGATAAAGPDCAPHGWESIWTCDPVEYVHGTYEHDGYLRFRDAMTAVDPEIRVGIVGVADPGSWNSWGERIMAEAADAIDVYAVHHYTADGPLDPFSALEAPRLDWPNAIDDLRIAFERHGLRDDVEIAVTEHNLISSLEGDEARQMPTALNAFHLAETIGQLVVHGIPIANQWNLANGSVDDSSDYGLIDTSTMRPTPAYFAMVLWSRLGDRLVQADVGADLTRSGLRVYATTSRSGADVHVLLINPSATTSTAELTIEPIADSPPRRAFADVVIAPTFDSRTVMFNGVATPSPDLADAPPQRLATPTIGDDAPVRFTHEVPALSMVVLHVVR